MSGPDERADDQGAADDAAEQMLAVSEELADTEQEAGWRSRSGTIRRRQRVVRGAAPQETEIRERVRVRSVAEEGVGGEPPTGPGPSPAPSAEEADAPVMLDAQGNPIDAPPASVTATSAAPSTAPDAGRFLADAVRRYLEGLDDLGGEHPVTVDRLAQLRRTVDRYERG